MTSRAHLCCTSTSRTPELTTARAAAPTSYWDPFSPRHGLWTTPPERDSASPPGGAPMGSRWHPVLDSNRPLLYIVIYQRRYAPITGRFNPESVADLAGIGSELAEPWTSVGLSIRASSWCFPVEVTTVPLSVLEVNNKHLLSEVRIVYCLHSREKGKQMIAA